MTNTIATAPDMHYINATIEGESIAIAAGAWLAGQQAGIWIQNSGLGNTINPVTSLLAPFEIPVLYITSRRGKPGINDEPQHELMGKVTSDILNLCEIEHAFLEKTEDIDSLFEQAAQSLSQRKSYGIVIDKGCVEKAPYIGEDNLPVKVNGVLKDLTSSDNPPRLSRYEILESVAQICGTDLPIIATTGKTGRELFTIRDSDNHFYMVGSMGYASSIGLGVAMNTSSRTVVIDGDGALLMNLGTLATIGHFAPDNLIHITIDNGLYESTGGQPTTSNTVDFAAIAHSCGYKHSFTVDDNQTFSDLLEKQIREELKGPVFICVKASTKKIENLARPNIHPKDVAHRFQQFITSKNV
jgi:phosphonopyruvate decarboxylase